ncbi:MAG: hypothetical protein IT564_07860 [Rhodospirillales bacterium]|nr:hypothetical protein [Rhodospirillales bacterium]
MDKAVDAAYGKTTFESEARRVAFLFELYQKLSSPLLPKAEKRPARRSGKRKKS